MSLRDLLGRQSNAQNAPCLGIDLGTTNIVASLGMKAVDLTSDPEAGVLLPSSVAFPPNGTVLVGTAALRRRVIDPENTIFSAKRVIGRKWGSAEAKEFRGRYPFRMQESKDGGVAFVTRAGTFTPVDIAVRLLSAVLRDLPADPATLPTVVAVPAAFKEPQRSATVAAARQAGLTHVSIIDEPYASALAYTSRTKCRIAAVYDLGGGTFDFALLNCEKQPFEILANDGDPFLGGNDVDHALATWAAEEILRRHGWDLRRDPEAFDRLVVECERAKIRLSYSGETMIELGQVDPVMLPEGEKLPVDHAKLNQLISDLVRRTFVICDDVLRRVHLRAQDVETVFLAGGSTQLPMVRSGLAHFFGKAPRDDITPTEVVSIGASMAAQLLARS